MNGGESGETTSANSVRQCGSTYTSRFTEDLNPSAS
jgi:hypothetical protein